MSATPLPPNACLLGILFVAKINSEAKVIFHYPPRPGEDNSEYGTYFKEGGGDDDDDSSSDDSSVSSIDDPLQGEDVEPDSQRDNHAPPDLDLDEAASASPEKKGIAIERHRPRWSDIFGYGAYDLANILTPRNGHKERFEVGLQDKTFLGWPLFSQDGSWSRKKKARKAKNLNDTGEDGVDENNDSEVDGSDRPRTRTRDEDKLEMFHVVYIMNPPLLEHRLRTKDMYDHVTKKFSKALKWEQARSNFVVREASVIKKTMSHYHSSRGNDFPLAPLYHDLIQASSLAKAMAIIFDCISTSRVAHVTLSPALSLSLQIPIPTSISTLPSPLSPQLPGLWLTTAASLPLDDDIPLSNTPMAAHFGLLLLSNPSTITADVKAIDSPLLVPLTHYLRISKPNKSFLQMSQISGIALTDIQYLASHLIQWRRARAIPPLNKRNTYIMSPNADMSKLASASSSFAKRFPTLPSLPKMLSMLSFTPRPFNTLIPSPDHKEAYLEILAYLFQGGWVTQLRSFVWVRVPTHIKRAVDQESQERHEAKGKEAYHRVDKTDWSSLEEDLGDPLSKSTSSLEAPAPPSPTPSTKSKSSAHTAIPLNTDQSSPSDLPLIIPHPRQPSSINSRYLSAMSKHVLRIQGKDNQEAWDKCVKYFDGKHALDAIVINEGWKRRKVAELINAWEAEGLLVRGRHW